MQAIQGARRAVTASAGMHAVSLNVRRTFRGSSTTRLFFAILSSGRVLRLQGAKLWPADDSRQAGSSRTSIPEQIAIRASEPFSDGNGGSNLLPSDNLPWKDFAHCGARHGPTAVATNQKFVRKARRPRPGSWHAPSIESAIDHSIASLQQVIRKPGAASC